jgi:hypothetical protein
LTEDRRDDARPSRLGSALLAQAARLGARGVGGKYDILYIRGDVAVWGWYTARLLIGFLVGITAWPRPWYLRGPLVGLLTLFPLTPVSLATPGCGAPCMGWNLVSATAIGTLVAGLARATTGRDAAV